MSLPKEWVVVGSGIQGRQIAATVLAHAAARGETVLGFLDDAPGKQGQSVADLPVLGPAEAWLKAHGKAVQVALALGDPKVRREAAERLRPLGAIYTPAIHPFTSVGPRVALGEGVIVHPGVVMMCDLKVGRFTIVGCCCSLSHDSEVGEFCFLSPGTRLAGFGAVGNECWTGMNTLVNPHRKIHDRAQTGAGAVVVHHVPEGVTVAGVPARPLKPKG